MHIPYAEQQGQFGPMAEALQSLVATLLQMTVDVDVEEQKTGEDAHGEIDCQVGEKK